MRFDRNKCRLMVSLGASVVQLAAAGTVIAQLDRPFPAVFELSSLEAAGGDLGFVIKGANALDLSGHAVSRAGDVNDDGVDDLIVGAVSGSPGGRLFAGSCYVLFGGSGVGSMGVAELSMLSAPHGFVINGIDTQDASGVSVSSAGDLNADGVVDLIIGANNANPNGIRGAGECYVVFGSADLGASGALELSSLNGANGFVINGFGREWEWGSAVAPAGDVNDDGIDDVIISGLDAYVVLGGPEIGSSGVLELSLSSDSSGVRIQGAGSTFERALAVSSAGDVNADGVPDLLVGASTAGINNDIWYGETYVVFGSSDFGAAGGIDVSLLDGSNGFVIEGIDPHDQSGWSVSSAGDVNADGFADLIVGAPRADPAGRSGAGESYVVFGSQGLGSSGVMELAKLSGTDGFVIRGAAAGDDSGSSVASAGDVDNDGVSDLIVGANASIPNGSAYVVFGRPGVGATGTLELSKLDGADGIVLNGVASGDRCGFSVSSAGDVNGDQVDDLIVGAPIAGLLAGESYVIYGRHADSCRRADTNGDGTTDPSDFNAWIAAFNAGILVCDQNNDGRCSPADFNAWILNYNSCN